MKYRPYLVPLQAFTALFLCAGMAWLIVVMAGFNPTPPTAMDIRMRSTADISMASMNSTAAALAVQLVSELVPTALAQPPKASVQITAVPTSTLGFVLIPVSGSSKTPAPTPFSLRALLFPPTKLHEPAPTRTPVSTATHPPASTNTAVPTIAPTDTNTAVPTSTPVPTHTSTAVPPTATTAPPPTQTNSPQPPTSTSVPQPTSTSAPTQPTNTSVPPPPPPTSTNAPPQPTNTSAPPPPPPTSTNAPPPTDTTAAAP